MADFDGVINPAANWPDVPQLGTAVIARGGAGGPMNAQASALAARDRLLLRLFFSEAATVRGFTLAGGSFEAGASITSSSQVLLHEGGQKIYAWTGVIPGGGLSVPAGSDPSENEQWVDKTAELVSAYAVGYQGPAAQQLQKNLAERFQSAFFVDFATEYLTMEEIDQIKMDYATGAIDQKPTVDITARLIRAISDLGGSNDITSAYLYEPAKVLQLPAGAMGLNLDALERVLVSRNNINIVGAGMFNTRLCHIGTGHANEMIRFKEAYACGLAHLTLDGGLPFNPVGTETYGVDIPLVLDQCAHFYSDGLNVCNYRHRGIQCTHLWESYLGTDLRIFNGGWFMVSGSDPGGLMFDDFRKESTAFPGSESNQVYIGKYAFSGNGSVYQFKSPCFNVRIAQVVAECRTYSGFVPSGIDVSKVVISGISSGVIVDQAWYYFHDQAAAAVGAGTTLFDFTNAGPGCYFNNQVVYQEIPTGSSGRALEVSKIVSNSSAHPINLQVSVEDKNCTTNFWNSASPGSLIVGDIYYRKDASRTADNFLGSFGPTNLIGRVTIAAGAFTTTPPLVYQYDGRSISRSAIDGGGSFDEYKCRAIANFNGASSGGGARMEKGIAVTRTGVGQYSATFTQAMPDANYAVNFSIVKAATATDAPELGSLSASGFTFAIRDAGGNYRDSTTICLSVFR